MARLGGLVAMGSGTLGVLYFPFHASAAFLLPPSSAEYSEFTGLLPWSDPFIGLAGSLLTFGTPEDVHTFYGRFGFFVMAGFAAGVLTLRHVKRGPDGRIAWWGFALSFAGIVLLAAALFANRWLGMRDWTFFVFEVPGLLLLLPGLPLLGVSTLRTDFVTPIAGWLLVAAFPGMVVLTVVTGHLSGGILLLDLSWILIGYSLITAKPTDMRVA